MQWRGAITTSFMPTSSDWRLRQTWRLVPYRRFRAPDSARDEGDDDRPVSGDPACAECSGSANGVSTLAVVLRTSRSPAGDQRAVVIGAAQRVATW